jgi:hypothetical protein
MEQSQLLTHCGSRKLTREELTAIPAPEGTPTHRPVPHSEMVAALVETLGFRHIAVVRDEYAVSPDGMKMFGVLDLETMFDGCRFHADCPIMPTNWGCNCWVVRGVHLESA